MMQTTQHFNTFFGDNFDVYGRYSAGGEIEGSSVYLPC